MQMTNQPVLNALLLISFMRNLVLQAVQMVTIRIVLLDGVRNVDVIAKHAQVILYVQLAKVSLHLKMLLKEFVQYSMDNLHLQHLLSLTIIRLQLFHGTGLVYMQAIERHLPLIILNKF